MKRLLSLLLFVLLVASGCGDGSGGSGNTLGFTASMIDDDTYYLSYEKDEETVQSTIVFSGDTATVTDEWYDADGVYQFKGTYRMAITLNDDGTLTGTSTSYEGSDTFTETSATSTASVVEWIYDSETWADDWSTEKPEGWFETGEFTADMIDDDTYYVSYEEDGLTVQQTITFSGDAASGYTVTVIQESYNASDTLESTETNVYGITLSDDGTLTSTADEGAGTFTLLSETADNLVVHGADDGYTYTGADSWYFSQPEDWL